MQAFFSTMFRFFITGVMTLLPLVVTVFVVGWLVRFADAYIGPSSSFGRFLVTVFGPSQQLYHGYMVGYLVVILLTILLGFLVTRATVKRFQQAIDATFHRIPLFGKIYKAVGQVVSLLGSKEEAGLERFGGVVEVDLGPVRMVGLLTSQERYALPDGREHLLVFVPNSPIPATGFNVLVPVDKVRRLDMPVEDLAKLFMSLGILAPQVLKIPFSRLRRVEDDDGSEVS